MADTAQPPPAPHTDVLVHGGRIMTMDDASTVVDAVLIRSGRVVATGESARAATDVPRIDLDGRVAMPGLVDGHPHLLHLATRQSGYVDLGDAVDFDDVVERFRARAATVPPGEWLVGTPIGAPYYFVERWYSDLAERTMPGRDVLDRASTRHPIYISAWAPRMPNVVAFNSLGLQHIALTDDLPERVCDVWIDKDRDGRLTGVLRGSVTSMYNFDPYWTQILRKLPPMYPGDLAGPTRDAIRRYNADGVTTVYEAHNMTADHIRAYRALRADGTLTMRVKAGMEVEQYAIPPFQPKSMSEFEAALELARSLCDDGLDDLLRVTDATLSDGGPCWPGLLHTLEPYRDPYGRPTRGRQFIDNAKKLRFAHFCAGHGIRASWVNGGPGDHQSCLDTLEPAADALALRGRGWMVQHGYLISPAQIDRYARLGFDFTTSMSFTWGKGDMIAERMGEKALRDLVPLARLVRSGMKVGLGSDWGPKHAPFEHIEIAQTHRFGGSGRRNDGPDQAVSRAQALRLWTCEVGRAIGWEGVGTLSPGSYGDLIVLDQDPLACPIEALRETRVLLTLLGGTAVHDSQGLAGHLPRR